MPDGRNIGMENLYLIGRLSVQDMDLLSRLSRYFDTIESRLKQGQGWFIFNADRTRAARLGRFILERLVECRPLISYYFVPWRDFALNAYMVEVELGSHGAMRPPVEADEHRKHEYNIALRVARDTYYGMLTHDLVIVSGLAPAHLHEAEYLDKVTGGRHERRRATILITPRTVFQLSADFQRLDPSGELWGRLFSRMYETSLIAV